MEDLKRRLEFKSSSVQNQALWKIYTEVLAKKKTLKIEVINSSSPEIAELKFLWECSCVGNNVVSSTACWYLVSLVTKGDAEFSYVINGFLNLVPSAKNLNAAVKAISDLLKLQVALAINQDQEYRCPYALRSPPHPFITVLTNRPDSWIYLQQQVKDICLSENQSVRNHSIQLLSPFLKFALLEPQQSLQYQPMRDSLQRALLHVAMTTDDGVLANSILKCFSKIVPYFQVQEKSQLTAACIFIIEILSACNRTKIQGIQSECITSIIHQAFVLCQESIEQNLNVKGLLEAMLEITNSNPKMLTSDEIIIAISSLLLKSCPEEQFYLLRIASSVMKTEDLTSVTEVAIGMLVLPCLQLSGATKLADKYTKKNSHLAADLLKVIDVKMEEFKEGKHKTFPESIAKSPFNTEVTPWANMCKKFMNDRQKSEQWLQNLQGKLENTVSIPENLASLISSLMLTTKCQKEVRLGLDVLVTISKADPVQAVLFLPFLLYYMGKTDDPSIKMATIKTIPFLAQHKYVVPPVMRTIQLLGTNPALKSISLQLLTDLWLLQDRTYPHLLKAIVGDTTLGETEKYSTDVLLAKAKAVRDVCKARGSQHGADMLGPISSILEQCTCPYGGASAALVLEGLYYLCEAEVIDIQSAWSVLGEQLSKDTRDVVKGMICQLFSLLPELQVKTPEFEKFQEFVLNILWLSAQKEGEHVSSAALESLSHYKLGDFKISHMADHIIEDFIAQGKSMVQLEEDQMFVIDDVIPYVPGVCYTRLLKELRPGVLKSYTNLLSTMVKEEVDNLPRGVFYSSLRQQGAVSSQNKAVLSLPDFILQQYEKTRQPGLRPGLAAGLLFSYDLPVDVGRDGKPRKHSIITRSKNYQQMFSTLLHEVLIQPSDWHRCMVSPQVWTTFVERLFGAMLEGRQAEIELQVKRDHISESDAEEKLVLSWMWVREQITDVIKGVSRGSPTMQGNAILSLAGLAWVVHKHACGLDKETRTAADNSTEYKSHSHWLTVVIDTMMSLMDVTYTPKGQLLGLCQQRAADDRLPAGILAQATAVVSFSQMIPFLVTMDTDIIFKVISLLQSRLPGETEVSDSPVVQFHVGLGLGRFLSGLIEDHFLDICGTKGIVEIWRVLDLYEQCCFSDGENISGALLGLGLIMSALCQEGKTEGRAHVASVLDKLMVSRKTATEPNQVYQALCVCLAMTAAAAFSANVLSAEQINVVVTGLMDSTIKYPEMSGPCLSFGLLSYSLQRLGHPGIAETRKQIYDSWIKQWNDPDTSCVQQVAVLTGLLAMVGTERTLVPIQSDTTSSILDISVDEVVRVSKTALTSSTDQGVQSSAAWILGHLYLAVSTATQSRSSVPPNYSYLPEQSLIRALVDFLIDAGKQGPELVHDDYVSTALIALQSCTQRPLPPVNWTGILSPLMRVNYGDGVKDMTLRLGIQQSPSSTSAAMFLTAWMVPPLYTSLPDKCIHQMYDSLPVLIKSASADTIKSFLQQGQKSYTEVKDTFHHFLFGFHRALKVNDPPQAITAVLHQAVQEVYKLPIAENDTLHLLAECLGSIPDELFDVMTEADNQSSDTFMKGLFVRCYLVGQGRQPIAILNSFIDSCISNPSCDFDTAEALLQHTFWQMTKHKTEFTSAMEKLKWLTDLLGHLSNEFKHGRKFQFLQEAYALESKPVGFLSSIYKFAASTLASAVILWNHLSSPIFLDIKCALLSDEFAMEPFTERSVVPSPTLFESSIPYFPVCASQLLIEPWSQILPKVYEWIGVFTSGENAVLESFLLLLNETVMALRNSTDFRKPIVWTEFINRIEVV